jgi:hypothetical protein
VGVAVVLKGAGVLDRQVGDLVVVVPGRVAALGDQPGHQVVGGTDGLVGLVDEPGLDFLPRVRVLTTGLVGQRLEFEFGVPALPLAEFALGGGAALLLPHHPVVFRTEALLQVPAAHRHPGGAGGQDDDDDDDDRDEYLC